MGKKYFFQYFMSGLFSEEGSSRKPCRGGPVTLPHRWTTEAVKRTQPGRLKTVPYGYGRPIVNKGITFSLGACFFSQARYNISTHT